MFIVLIFAGGEFVFIVLFVLLLCSGIVMQISETLSPILDFSVSVFFWLFLIGSILGFIGFYLLTAFKIDTFVYGFFALILSVLYGTIFFDFVSILTRDSVELLGLIFMMLELSIFIIAAAPGAIGWLLYISGYEETETVLMSIALLLIGVFVLYGYSNWIFDFTFQDIPEFINQYLLFQKWF